MKSSTATEQDISQKFSDTPPAHGEYWPGQGGRYICSMAASLGLPARHLIIGDSEAEGMEFGSYLDVQGARSHLDGPKNTAALLATEKPHPAAAWAAAQTADGHTDFHLPSRVDMLMAYIHAPQLFKKDGWHWTSTQYSRCYAFAQGFEGGGSYWDLKDNERRARAFRWIQA